MTTNVLKTGQEVETSFRQFFSENGLCQVYDVESLERQRIYKVKRMQISVDVELNSNPFEVIN